MLLNHSRFLLNTKDKYADLFSCVILMSDVHRPQLRHLLGGRINSIMIKSRNDQFYLSKYRTSLLVPKVLYLLVTIFVMGSSTDLGF